MKPRIFTPHPYQKMISDHILDVPRCAVWYNGESLDGDFE